MSSSEWTQLILAVLCAVGASLLVAVETALSIMTKSRAERMVESGLVERTRYLVIQFHEWYPRAHLRRWRLRRALRRTQ